MHSNFTRAGMSVYVQLSYEESTHFQIKMLLFTRHVPCGRGGYIYVCNMVIYTRTVNMRIFCNT